MALGKTELTEFPTEIQSNENELDYIISLFGNKFGKYQLKNSVFVCIPVIFGCMFMISYVLTSRNLDYRCKIPGCETVKQEYDPSWLRNAVPYDNNKPSQCQKYLKISNSFPCTNETFDRNVVQTCNEFVFAGDDTTILNDFNLECDDNLWKLTIVGTVSGSGQIVALPISGYISDRYGRRIVILGGLMLSSIIGNLRSFSPTYPWFLAFEFLDQLCGSSAFIGGLVLGAELVSPEKRTLMCTLIYICFPIGEIIVGAVAWLTQSWRLLLRCLYTPCFFLIAFFWLTPESLTWLLSKGKLDTVKSMLQNAARTNNIQLSEETLSKLDAQINTNVTKSEKTGSILLILKSRLLLFRLIIFSFCLLTINLIFFGLILRSVGISGNDYLNFILVSLIEIPAHITNCFLVQKMGRKLMLCSTLILGGLACIAYIFIPEDAQWLQLTAFLVGKFAVSIAFAVTCILCTEVFPTFIRNSALGFSGMAGMFGSIAAPQFALIAKINKSLPYIIFGCLASLSALLALLLPETLNKKLPNTIEEAENVGMKGNRVAPLQVIEMKNCVTIS